MLVKGAPGHKSIESGSKCFEPGAELYKWPRDIENVLYFPTGASTRAHTRDNPVGGEAYVDVGRQRRETHAKEAHQAAGNCDSAAGEASHQRCGDGSCLHRKKSRFRMTSWRGNAFRVTGTFWGKSTDSLDREPERRSCDALFGVSLNKLLNKHSNFIVMPHDRTQEPRKWIIDFSTGAVVRALIRVIVVLHWSMPSMPFRVTPFSLGQLNWPISVNGTHPYSKQGHNCQCIHKSAHPYTFKVNTNTVYILGKFCSCVHALCKIFLSTIPQIYHVLNTFIKISRPTHVSNGVRYP